MAAFSGRAKNVQTNVVALTASYTLKVTDIDTVFTNRGAGGAVTITLPAPSEQFKGFDTKVIVIADQNVLVATATADTLIVVNDLTADSLAVSTSSQKIGSVIQFFCDGTSWIAWGAAIGAGGDTGTNTYTVATA